MAQNSKKRKMSQRQVRRILYWIIIALLIVVIVGCLALLGLKYYNDHYNDNMYDDIAADVEANAGTRPTIPPTDTPPTTLPPASSEPTEPSTEPTEPTEPPLELMPGQDENGEINDSIIFQYQAPYALNNDMVGWIKIEGTQINYPVVQSKYHANFYLRRNFKKEHATCGTVYVREACDVNKPSDNITIYGHNMRNGTMFADLHKYKDKSFWEDHKYIFFDTLTEYHTYEVFAVFRTSADPTKGFSYHIFDDAETEKDFNVFVSTCQNISYYDTGIDPVYGDKLITLSTCDKSIEDGRLVVVARRVF